MGVRLAAAWAAIHPAAAAAASGVGRLTPGVADAVAAATVIRPAGAARDEAHIDWTQRRLIASGVGRAPTGVVLLAEALPMAEQAAREAATRALRQLLCTSKLLPAGAGLLLQGADPDADGIEHGVLRRMEQPGRWAAQPAGHSAAEATPPGFAGDARLHREMATAIEKALLSAQATETSYRADGSVAITASLALDGSEGGLGDAWLAWRRERAPGAAPASQSSHQVQAPGDKARNRHALPASAEARPPSGVVIEARNIGLEPSLWPQLARQTTLQPVYGANSLPDELFRAFGVAPFVRSMETALRDPRVADRALIVRAVGLSPNDPATILIADADADAIAAHPHLLREGRVVFVTE